jgi:hypothetical protein
MHGGTAPWLQDHHGEPIKHHDEIVLRFICVNRREPLPVYSRIAKMPVIWEYGYR